MSFSRLNTQRPRTSRTRHRDRRGAAAVECAMLAPLLAAIVFGALDVGQFINVAQTVNEASREGARRASRNTVTNVSEVETAVHSYMADAFPGVATSDLNAGLTVTVTDSAGAAPPSGDLTTISTGSSVSVEVSFQYNTVRWFEGFASISGQSIQKTTVMRRD